MMQFPNPPIRFFKVRTFGEKFNTAFDFLRETWKPLLKFSLYLILPVCLIQAFAMNAYIRFVFSMAAMNTSSEPMGFLFSFLASYGVLILCILLGSCLLSSLVYTLMQEYERRENRLLDITFADFKDHLWQNLRKMVRVTLFFVGVFIVCMLVFALLSILSPWTLVLTIPLLLIGMLAFSVPCSIFMPLYIFEDQPFSVALRRAFKYGFSAWGEIFLVILVFGLLGSIVSTVTMIPWYIMVLVKSVFTLAGDDPGITASWGYELILYILGIFQSYGTYLSGIITSVGLAFQYFHLREKKEGLSVNERIAHFDRL